LTDFIPDHERIVLIEDTAEIHVQKANVLRFKARGGRDFLPAVTIRDLLNATLRHRPYRIIPGEIRGGEAFDLLQLLNAGHNGTISTVHANSAVQGLSRFTTCVLESGVEMLYRAIKHNIADSLNVVVQIERRPGARFLSEVLEIQDYEPTGDCYHLESIYSRHEERLERVMQRGAGDPVSGYPPSGLLAPRGIVEPEILMREVRSDG
jgi:pilus assembly protein CpaF